MCLLFFLSLFGFEEKAFSDRKSMVMLFYLSSLALAQSLYLSLHSQEALPHEPAVHRKDTTTPFPFVLCILRLLGAAQGLPRSMRLLLATVFLREEGWSTCTSGTGGCTLSLQSLGPGPPALQPQLLSRSPRDSPKGSFQAQVHHLPRNLAALVHRCANLILK